MSIKVERENLEELKKWGLGLERVHERCVFCRNGTPFWHLPTNNPVCPDCATAHEDSELPARGKSVQNDDMAFSSELTE
jgi:hypothetical protein